MRISSTRLQEIERRLHTYLPQRLEEMSHTYVHTRLHATPRGDVAAHTHLGTHTMSPTHEQEKYYDGDERCDDLFDGFDDAASKGVPLKISQDLRAAVIEDWLSGKPGDTIAHDSSLSAGSVSSIISEYRNDLTCPIADALRELGIMLRKSRITPSQCALGFRLANIMKEMKTISLCLFPKFIINARISVSNPSTSLTTPNKY